MKERIKERKNKRKKERKKERMAIIPTKWRASRE